MDDATGHNHNVDVTPHERMVNLVEALSAYIEQYHGGWVRLVSFEGNELEVEMGGACRECHLSATTLYGWVQGTVRQFFPDVIVTQAK